MILRLFQTHRALVILTLVGTANAVDRYIIGMALPQIRTEFSVGDAWLGLLSGPAFAVTYAVCGMPLALLADRAGRRWVITGALAVFSTTTLACGLAGGFWQLAAARLATGLGEAGTTSPSTALIAELYPHDRRTGALSLFAASGSIGLVLAFFGGGFVADHYGWRVLFFVSAAFGYIVLAAMGTLFPKTRQTRALADPRISMRAALAVLWTRPAVAWVATGAAVASVGGYAAAAFVPSFLARSHHMTPSAIGITLAALAGTFGWAGTALPGLLADRWKPQDAGAGLKVASLGLLVALPFQPLFYLASDLSVTILAAIPPMFVSAIFIGPCFAAMQQVTDQNTRAQAAALLLLVLNLIGLGLGPQLVGLTSSLLQPLCGTNALRYALLIVATGPICPAAWCFWRAGRILQRATVMAG